MVDQCLERSPEASVCRDTRLSLDGEEGHCDAMLADARTLVAQEPEVPASYERLAQALAANQATPESIQQAIDQAESHEIASTLRPKGLTRIELSTLVGDFDAAGLATMTLSPTVARTRQRAGDRLRQHDDDPARRRGRRSRRGAGGGRRVRAAVTGVHAECAAEVRAKRLYLLHEAGQLPDASFAAALDALLTEGLANRNRRGRCGERSMGCASRD